MCNLFFTSDGNVIKDRRTVVRRAHPGTPPVRTCQYQLMLRSRAVTLRGGEAPVVAAARASQCTVSSEISWPPLYLQISPGSLREQRYIENYIRVQTIFHLINHEKNSSKGILFIIFVFYFLLNKMRKYIRNIFLLFTQKIQASKNSRSSHAHAQRFCTPALLRSSGRGCSPPRGSRRRPRCGTCSGGSSPGR